MEGEIIIVGAGAHARVVFDILRAGGLDRKIVAFIDVEGKGEEEIGVKTMFGRQVIDTLEEMKSFVSGRDITAIIGHGNNSRRRELLPMLEDMGLRIGSAIHPAAIISPDVEIGPSTTISAGAIIITGAKIGRGVIINTAATIDHDCEIGDFAQIAPGANIAGRVIIGEEAFIGIGAVVIQNIMVGPGAVVGASAAVVRDVPDRTLVIGVPARVRKRL